MSKNYHYAIREISITDGAAHSCTGHITAVLGATYNSGQHKWYLTVLVERPEDEVRPRQAPEA